MVSSKFELSGTLDEIEECIMLVFWLRKFYSWFVCCLSGTVQWMIREDVLQIQLLLLLILNFNNSSHNNLLHYILLWAFDVSTKGFNLVVGVLTCLMSKVHLST